MQQCSLTQNSDNGHILAKLTKAASQLNVSEPRLLRYLEISHSLFMAASPTLRLVEPLTATVSAAPLESVLRLLLSGCRITSQQRLPAFAHLVLAHMNDVLLAVCLLLFFVINMLDGCLPVCENGKCGLLKVHRAGK